MNMAAIRIVTVCAVAVVAVAWEAPAIPAGRRAQFYLLKGDGGYQYGYDTGAGHSASAAADAANEVLGTFQYKAADGRDVAVRYTAGQGGYMPEVSGVSGVKGVAADAGRNLGSRAGVVSATVTNAAEQDPDYDANADASYSFRIDTDSYQRTEQADARGNVHGSYSYSSPQGGSHALSYAAGEGTGFVVTGGAPSPAAGAVVGAIAGGRVGAGTTGDDVSGGATNTDGSYSFSFNTPDQSRQESADAKNNVRGSYSFRAKDDGKSRRVDYEAGADTGFVARGDHLPVAPAAPSIQAHAQSLRVSPAAPATLYSGPLANIQSAQNADGSYTFAFGTDFISREESADAQNNVRGSYSYTSADDGKTRRVDYEAGAATGFLARGNHLPVPPSVPGAPTSHSAQLPIPESIPSVVPYSGPVADVKDSTNIDGSYSFSFNTPDQSRQESADAQNNVRGSYSFKAKEDGKELRVDYEAGTATGFIARGNHLPVTSASPAAHGKAGTISPVSVPSSSYLPPSTSSFSGPATDSRATSDVDGSYSFSYSTNDHSRQESGDTHNNVRGSFSFTAPDDGQTRRIDYEAGAATGFVAKGAHLPVAPAAPVAPSHPSAGSYAAPTLPALALPTPSLSVSSNFASSDSQSTLNADGSYGFSYSADDHSREESADSQNNVRGSYSFRAKDDGKTRRVNYEAGAATGFIARGDHLPRAPTIAAPAPASPGVSSARVSAGHTSTSRGGASAVNADSSYSFSYDAGDHSRQEAGDAAGNVRGSYSFVLKDDGHARRVDYIAGADTGFVAKGEHLPVPVPANLGTAARASSFSSHSADDGSSEDSSYSYSYKTDSSRKTESADARGNVRGEYSYTGGDGATRTVSYTASDSQGFVASGDLGPSAAGIAKGAGTRTPGSVTAGSGHSHGASTIRKGGLTIKQFLPPQSARKYGYVYDTKS